MTSQIAFLLSLLFTILPSSLVYAQPQERIDLSKCEWEYRWGDSPFENNIPLWSIEDPPTDKWVAINYPSDPPDRNGQTNIWYRVKLPEILTKDPHFYVLSIDIIPEVYYKGKLIYKFGELNQEGKGQYAGWPWHMFDLPPDSGGEFLYFRIYSNYLDIGFFGEMLVTSKGEIVENFLDDDIPKIVVGSIALFIAFIFLISFLTHRKRIELFIIGSLFLTQGLGMLCAVRILQLYFFAPLAYIYIRAIAFFYFPVGMALYLDKTIPRKLPFNIFKKTWKAHLIYLTGAIAGALLGFFEIPATYEYFDIIYYSFTLPVITICLLYFFVTGTPRVKLITTSFLIISIYHVLSFLICSQILPWVEPPQDLAIFLCLLLLSYSIVRNLNYTHELEEQKEELVALSSIDHLTKLYNRKEIDKILLQKKKSFTHHQTVFSIIMADVDDFKQVNDIHGHLTGDTFLIELGKLLSTHTREPDKVGRWGGEEFIIICSQTGKQGAMTMAEKLRKKIERHTFPEVGHKTISLGVSTYTEGDSIPNLLSRADQALYISKKEGKNQVNYQ